MTVLTCWHCKHYRPFKHDTYLGICENKGDGIVVNGEGHCDNLEARDDPGTLDGVEVIKRSCLSCRYRGGDVVDHCAYNPPICWGQVIISTQTNVHPQMGIWPILGSIESLVCGSWAARFESEI